MVLRNPSCVRRGGHVIRFSIESVNCQYGTIVGQVLAVACGAGPLPDVDSDGMVDLVDALGCMIGGSSALLIGTQGYASYMQPYDPEDGECRWEITALCSPELQC